MSEPYETKLEALRDEIERNGARPKVIDNFIFDMWSTCRDRMRAEDLILLLSERGGYNEGMWSLVQAAEQVDPSSYVRSLLAVAPSISRSAPRWASTLLIRILNDDRTRSEAAERLKTAPEPVRDAVRVLCARINAEGPELLDKTAVLLSAME